MLEGELMVFEDLSRGIINYGNSLVLISVGQQCINVA